ncbi:hypothetical protein EX30DRAFT_116632 [Ascodesmis nigricans]|uniref:Uncharacterized protein n=1 Tax=Ascodesmis nigricans TaxID=341454 RepID=A0A4S2MSL6_9PEZI|nr:hypothetical protein EX30DRAFT_116632 [Ascodesmis nigricans]
MVEVVSPSRMSAPPVELTTPSPASSIPYLSFPLPTSSSSFSSTLAPHTHSLGSRTLTPQSESIPTPPASQSTQRHHLIPPPLHCPTTQHRNQPTTNHHPFQTLPSLLPCPHLHNHRNHNLLIPRTTRYPSTR